MTSEPVEVEGREDQAERAGLDETAARLCWFVLLYGILAAALLVAVGSVQDVLILTAGVAASIFLLRSLRAQVFHLDVREPHSGVLVILRMLGRFGALALLLLALFEFGTGRALAVALAAAGLPCALLVETVLQVLDDRARA